MEYLFIGVGIMIAIGHAMLIVRLVWMAFSANVPVIVHRPSGYRGWLDYYDEDYFPPTPPDPKYSMIGRK